METVVKGVIGLGYVSLMIELVFLHVPSVASNRSIWCADQATVAQYSDRFKWLFRLPQKAKIIVLFIPLIGVYFVFVIPVFYLFGLEFFSTPKVFESNPVLNLLGLSLITFGRLVTLSSVVTIRQDNSQQHDDYKLHTNSLFNTSRNPGLLGMYIFMLGVWICIPSVWLLLGLVYYVAYMHVKVRMEEDFLSNKFGTTYQRYLNQTGRYLS